MWEIHVPITRNNPGNPSSDNLRNNNTDDEALIAHMEGNKADTALKLFECPEDLAVPEYIRDAVR